MIKLIAFILIGVALVFGSAFILLRTARRPKLPRGVKPKPYSDDDDETRW